MQDVPPTPGFKNVKLVIASATLTSGRSFGRIHRKKYTEPLGYGKNATRFSDPRRRIDRNRFGILYLGSTLKVCFLETVLRDQRDGVIGDVWISESEITDRFYSKVLVEKDLQLIDLRGDGPVRMGIPSNVVRGRTQSLARLWSVAFYEHPETIDGIIYPSRLNNEVNLAIYDRAIIKLKKQKTVSLKHAPGLGTLLNDFNVALL